MVDKINNMNPQKGCVLITSIIEKNNFGIIFWMVIILIGHKSEKDPFKICFFHPCIMYLFSR